MSHAGDLVLYQNQTHRLKHYVCACLCVCVCKRGILPPLPPLSIFFAVHNPDKANCSLKMIAKSRNKKILFSRSPELCKVTYTGPFTLLELSLGV